MIINTMRKRCVSITYTNQKAAERNFDWRRRTYEAVNKCLRQRTLSTAQYVRRWLGRRGSPLNYRTVHRTVLPISFDFVFEIGVRFSPRQKWLGRRGSNPRMTESKSVALPLGYSPPYPQCGYKKMGWDIRVELMTSSATNWRPNQLGQSHHISYWRALKRVLVPSALPKNWRAVGDSPLNYETVHRTVSPASRSLRS